MLNKKNIRELCYVVRIDDIEPIPGKDKVECAVVGGWTIMVRKGEFKPGDLGIYFEVDSQVPAKKQFEFLASKHYKIKTQKYKTTEGVFYSQGLLMHANDFGFNIVYKDNQPVAIGCHYLDDESRFLTKELGIIYASLDDNKRKLLYKKQPITIPKSFKWLAHTKLGYKLCKLLFKPRVQKWPYWVKRTDEERIQNIPYILKDKSEWIVTEKLDGTSTTFTLKKDLFKTEFYVCSRNLIVTNKENIYYKMALKYDIERKLKRFLKNNPELNWVTIQGETYGPGIQKRTYSCTEPQFRVFNFITSDKGRYNTIQAANICKSMDILFVPIIDEHFILFDTIEEILDYANGTSVLDNGMREGFVFRSQDGTKSFKAVSNEYLMKYHQ